MPLPSDGRISARPRTHSGAKPPQPMRCGDTERQPGYPACLNRARWQAALKTDERRNILTRTHEPGLGRKEPVPQECRHSQAASSGVPSPLAKPRTVPKACLIWASALVPSDDGDSAAGNFPLSVTGVRARRLSVAADAYAGEVPCHGLCTHFPIASLGGTTGWRKAPRSCPPAEKNPDAQISPNRARVPSKSKMKDGGRCRIRTCDPLRVREMR